MLEILRNRRSIRRFQERSLTEVHMASIEEAILRAPSAKNLKSWEYIIVDDKKLLKKLSEVRGGSSSFIASASVAVVVLGNEKAIDTWIEDASLAAMIAQLTATSLGLGSCWAQIRNRDHTPQKSAEDYVRELLGVPRHFRVVCVIAIGYPAEEKDLVAKEDLPFEKIHRNHF